MAAASNENTSLATSTSTITMRSPRGGESTEARCRRRHWHRGRRANTSVSRVGMLISVSTMVMVASTFFSVSVMDYHQHHLLVVVEGRAAFSSSARRTASSSFAASSSIVSHGTRKPQEEQQQQEECSSLTPTSSFHPSASPTTESTSLTSRSMKKAKKHKKDKSHQGMAKNSKATTTPSGDDDDGETRALRPSSSIKHKYKKRRSSASVKQQQHKHRSGASGTTTAFGLEQQGRQQQNQQQQRRQRREEETFGSGNIVPATTVKRKRQKSDERRQRPPPTTTTAKTTWSTKTKKTTTTAFVRDAGSVDRTGQQRSNNHIANNNNPKSKSTSTSQPTKGKKRKREKSSKARKSKSSHGIKRSSSKTIRSIHGADPYNTIEKRKERTLPGSSSFMETKQQPQRKAMPKRTGQSSQKRRRSTGKMVSSRSHKSDSDAPIRKKENSSHKKKKKRSTKILDGLTGKVGATTTDTTIAVDAQVQPDAIQASTTSTSIETTRESSVGGSEPAIASQKAKTPKRKGRKKIPSSTDTAPPTLGADSDSANIETRKHTTEDTEQTMEAATTGVTIQKNSKSKKRKKRRKTVSSKQEEEKEEVVSSPMEKEESISAKTTSTIGTLLPLANAKNVSQDLVTIQANEMEEKDIAKDTNENEPQSELLVNTNDDNAEVAINGDFTETSEVIDDDNTPDQSSSLLIMEDDDQTITTVSQNSSETQATEVVDDQSTIVATIAIPASSEIENEEKENVVDDEEGLVEENTDEESTNLREDMEHESITAEMDADEKSKDLSGVEEMDADAENKDKPKVEDGESNLNANEEARIDEKVDGEAMVEEDHSGEESKGSTNSDTEGVEIDEEETPQIDVDVDAVQDESLSEEKIVDEEETSQNDLGVVQCESPSEEKTVGEEEISQIDVDIVLGESLIEENIAGEEEISQIEVDVVQGESLSEENIVDEEKTLHIDVDVDVIQGESLSEEIITDKESKEITENLEEEAGIDHVTLPQQASVEGDRESTAEEIDSNAEVKNEAENSEDNTESAEGELSQLKVEEDETVIAEKLIGSQQSIEGGLDEKENETRHGDSDNRGPDLEEPSSKNGEISDPEQDVVSFIEEVLQENVRSWIEDLSTDSTVENIVNKTRGGHVDSEHEVYDEVFEPELNQDDDEIVSSSSNEILERPVDVVDGNQGNSEDLDPSVEELKEKVLMNRESLETLGDKESDAIISVVTWNLAEDSPSEEDAAFIRNFRKNGITPGQGSDLVLISGQECENIKPRRSEGRRSREYRRLMIKMLGKDYVPVALHLLGGIQFGLFAKKSFLKEIEDISVVDVTCGIGNVFHNKGAIAAFVTVKARNEKEKDTGKKRSKSLRMVFATAHLAAHVKNAKARDSDFWRISSELQAQAPEGFLPRKVADESSSGSFLFDSVDRVFFCGDLNYRLDLPRELTEHTILHKTKYEKPLIKDLLLHDQLIHSMVEGKAFPAFGEGKITFMPTFKYDKESSSYDTSHKQRIPAWTDRILFQPADDIRVLNYQSVPEAQSSDHRPVYGTYRIGMEGRVIPPSLKKRKRRQLKDSSSHYVRDY